MQNRYTRARIDELSLDFVAGLITGEGTFYWTSARQGKIPVFALKMHMRDYSLIVQVCASLKLDERVYRYHHGEKDYALLLVRSIGSLKNTIIPSIYPRLAGYKRRQFLEWFKGFYDPETVEWFRFFPNALRGQFPELCDKETLEDLLAHE